MTRLQAAPQAPGGLGQAAPAPELLDFLDGLTRWRGERRQELDRIDAASLLPGRRQLTSDLALALSMWQAVSDRLDRLTEVWDSGRVTAKGREEMSRLIWGRLDTGPGAAPTGSFGVSLVEAARLCDALTSTLRGGCRSTPRPPTSPPASRPSAPGCTAAPNWSRRAPGSPPRPAGWTSCAAGSSTSRAAPAGAPTSAGRSPSWRARPRGSSAT